MQKTDKNASILIWTIFLSIIISMTFLGISTKIHKNIKNSGDFVDNINTSTEIQNYLKTSQLSQEYIDANFSDNITLNFENQQDISRGLAENEHIEMKIQDTSGADIQIDLDLGGPVIYKYQNSSNITTSSGVIDTQSSFNINSQGSIFIKNLGGNTHFTVFSTSGSLLPPNISYSIERKIGNLQSTQSNGSIYNFTSGAFQ